MQNFSGRDTDVLISGAGIAGSAAAYWLTRAGLSVTVVERHPEPRRGGQAVDLRGAGRTVVGRMGLLDAAREIAVDQAGFQLIGPSGKSLGRVGVDAFGGEGMVSEIEILRGDLAELLHRATLPDTEYIFDDTVTAVSQDDDGVTVSFENSGPRRCRLLIGADGSHSVVRRLAFPDEQEAVHPLGCYNAWFTLTDSDIDTQGWFQMFNAPGGLVAGVRPGRQPGEIKASLSFRSDAISYDRRDQAAQQSLLDKRFAGAGWHVPQILDEMRRADDFFFDSIDQVRMRRWHQGRVALLGDAGYCPTSLTGLGTSLALVGAYVLAGEFCRTDDHRIALANYQTIMQPYVDQAQQLPPGGISGYAPNTALMIRLRSLSMTASTRWPLRAIFAAQFHKADAIDLPNYEFAELARPVDRSL
ncbi:FAD-dependent oxidoreductase [Microlunatus sp. Gsoil 973]|uniref:FAD-dependent oxidoreductase n=1 Tax=Microlunatus sp. Gsoil 973 TaxID=2672569 RepID=UPI0012B4CAFB|nr:FAD-dependent oxidoreductase [Microlunatus sp. Gsoil 973]QGN34236.1 FAD-dependent oxidoreductase [Microlunatus sp. Gsoil 973]